MPTITREKYFEMLEAVYRHQQESRKNQIQPALRYSAVSIDKDGNILDRLVPGTYLYIACGEEGIEWLDENMVVHQLNLEL